MGLSVNTNVASLTAQHNLNRTSSALNKSIERLSSGLKINRGADGPAGLVISEKNRAQIAGLNAAIENASKAVSVVQTAEGALNEVNSLLTRVRSLAIDSANTGVNDADALAANQAEITNALDTINRIANNTQFGERSLLDGSAGRSGQASDVDVTVLSTTTNTTEGNYAVAISTAAERANLTAGTQQTAVLATDEDLTVNGVVISLSAGLSAAQVIDRVNEFTSETGVVAEDNTGLRLRSVNHGANESVSAISNVAAAASSSGIGTALVNDTGVDIVGTIDGLAASGSGNLLTANSGAANGLSLSIADASTTTTATGAQGSVTVVDNSLVFQIGANQNQTVSVGVDQVNPSSLGVGVAGNQFANLGEITVTSAAAAQDALAVIDAAINEVASARGDLGAFQANTLESTANNLRTTLENTVSAESVIRDTDFAQEIAEFTKNQVLVQAGTSTLGNANQSAQLVLSLL
ncbi:MAG: flagellin [Planctomycetaceae bacterium]